MIQFFSFSPLTKKKLSDEEITTYDYIFILFGELLTQYWTSITPNEHVPLMITPLTLRHWVAIFRH